MPNIAVQKKQQIFKKEHTNNNIYFIKMKNTLYIAYPGCQAGADQEQDPGMLGSTMQCMF